MTKTEQNALQHVATVLEALADPNSTSCGVDPAAREAVSAYIKTWCIPQLNALAKPSHKRDYADKYIVKATGNRRQFT